MRSVGDIHFAHAVLRHADTGTGKRGEYGYEGF